MHGLNFSELLRHQIKESGLTKYSLAKKSGVSESLISRISRSKNYNVTLHVMDKLLKTLKITLKAEKHD